MTPADGPNGMPPRGNAAGPSAHTEEPLSRDRSMINPDFAAGDAAQPAGVFDVSASASFSALQRTGSLRAAALGDSEAQDLCGCTWAIRTHPVSPRQLAAGSCAKFSSATTRRTRTQKARFETQLQESRQADAPSSAQHTGGASPMLQDRASRAALLNLRHRVRGHAGGITRAR